jgi:putative ABC transport system substrate-binding protein
MKRREFIALIGGVATAWPVATHAQQTARPLVGYLHGGSRDSFAAYFKAFRDGLSETGFIDGHNVKIEDHWAEGNYDRMPEIAADLVRRQAAVIVVGGGAPSVISSKVATAGARTSLR